MNPAIRENTHRGRGTICGACVVNPLSPTGGESGVRGSSDALYAGIRSAFVILCTCLSATLTPVGIVNAEPPRGAVVGWGSQVVGVDLSAGFVAVAGGDFHSLGLNADGSIVGRGDNSLGQTNVPAPNTGFVAIAADGRHSLGLKADGSIVGWGGNGSGQTDVPAPNTGFTAVAAGANHSLGLKADGSVVAWGSNGFGQTNVSAPNTGFVAVAAGYLHSLGLKADGSIVPWGCGGPNN